MIGVSLVPAAVSYTHLDVYKRQFQYTVKDLARPATGLLRIDGVEHEIGGAAGEAWAVLDHGRGRWPYDIQWNWGAGSGRSQRAGGRVIGVQLGAKWTEGTGCLLYTSRCV